jgi:hypothetical protein
MADRPPGGDAADKRARRSAEALRANLRRRKAQERQREATDPADEPDIATPAPPAVPRRAD